LLIPPTIEDLFNRFLNTLGGNDPPGIYGFYQKLVITLGLIGVGHGEVGNSFIEAVAFAQITGNR
jgi:hypothetical protein